MLTVKSTDQEHLFLAAPLSAQLEEVFQCLPLAQLLQALSRSILTSTPIANPRFLFGEHGLDAPHAQRQRHAGQRAASLRSPHPGTALRGAQAPGQLAALRGIQVAPISPVFSPSQTPHSTAHGHSLAHGHRTRTRHSPTHGHRPPACCRVSPPRPPRGPQRTWACM